MSLFAACCITDQPEIDGPVSQIASYANAFLGDRAADEFLTYVVKAAGGELSETTWTRGEFWAEAQAAAAALAANGVGKGDRVTHFFSQNDYKDILFRLGASMIGAVPVTVNWEADPVERFLYKLTSTKSKVVLVDAGTPEWGRVEGAKHAIVLDTATVDLTMGEVAVAPTGPEDTKIIIFTSGTTGNPKGVQLAYRSYDCNRSTFEAFLEVPAALPLTLVLANPLHHTNSTAMSDWACRRPTAKLVLFAKYTTAYWKRITEIGAAAAPEDKLVCPSVSKHYDFLEALMTSGKLPVPAEALMAALSRPNTHMLLGSAPVGPQTVERLLKYTGKLPVVRFGSTETCLQCLGTPLSLSEDQRHTAFKAGWANAFEGKSENGYYIGQQHPGLTEMKVVKSKDRASNDFMVECAPGQPGQLLIRGQNLMTGYVDNPAATKAVFIEPADGSMGLSWYTNLGDVCFYLLNPVNGGLDVYWCSRDNALLIKGGSNYSYDQIQDDLTKFIESKFDLKKGADFELAVVGLRLRSEHEDDCWLTISLISAAARKRLPQEWTVALQKTAKQASSGVSKGSLPDFIRFVRNNPVDGGEPAADDKIPKNFKGAIKVPELAAACLAEAEAQMAIDNTDGDGL